MALLISLMPLTAISLIAYNLAHDTIEAAINNQLEAIATIQKHHVENIIDRQKERLDLVRTRTPMLVALERFYKTGEKSQQEIAGSALSGAKSAIEDFKEIYILNPQGRVVASTNASLLNRDLSQEEYFEKGLKGYSLDIFSLAGRVEGLNYLSCPVTWNNRLLGVLVIESSLDPITSLTSDYTGLGKTGEILLARREKNGAALFLTPLREDKDAALKRSIAKDELRVPMTQALLKNEQPPADSTDYRGKEIYAAIRYIEETDWGLVVKIDKDEIHIPINRFRNLLLITIFIAAIVAILISLWFSRSVTGPIISLANTVRRVDDGDLSARSELTSDDEVGMLATVFNDMTDKLLGLYSGLEDKVKKRTEEVTKLNEELKRHSIELDSINKELETFNYSVSHDLRAPLRAIDGFSLALLEDYNERLDEQGRDYLQRVRAATQRMGHLIDAMLRLSRLSRSEMRIGTVDLSVIAREITNELSKDQPERKAEFIIQDRMTTKGDINLLRILLENLIGNAWKFTANTPEPKIEFGVNLEAGDKVYFVSDNGSGFEMAYANKLFAPFQRLHSDTEFPGLGIGLATVKRIIYRHGGTIRAEAEVGKGAAFYFKLNVV